MNSRSKSLRFNPAVLPQEYMPRIADVTDERHSKHYLIPGKVFVSAEPVAVSTIVGTGQKGDRLVPTDPLATEVFRPHGVRMSPGGDLIITDSYNHRVLRLRRQT